MQSSKHKCPICKSQVLISTDGNLPKSFPFCSERCKLMDLGAWAKEEYRIQAEDQSSDQDGNETETE